MNGRLTARGRALELVEAARDAESTPDALALAGVLAQPWADVVLRGATTVDELASNLAALGLALETEPELIERLDTICEDPVTYWKTRAALPWN